MSKDPNRIGWPQPSHNGNQVGQYFEPQQQPPQPQQPNTPGFGDAEDVGNKLPWEIAYEELSTVVPSLNENWLAAGNRLFPTVFTSTANFKKQFGDAGSPKIVYAEIGKAMDIIPNQSKAQHDYFQMFTEQFLKGLTEEEKEEVTPEDRPLPKPLPALSGLAKSFDIRAQLSEAAAHGIQMSFDVLTKFMEELNGFLEEIKQDNVAGVDANIRKRAREVLDLGMGAKKELSEFVNDHRKRKIAREEKENKKVMNNAGGFLFGTRQKPGRREGKMVGEYLTPRVLYKYMREWNRSLGYHDRFFEEGSPGFIPYSVLPDGLCHVHGGFSLRRMLGRDVNLTARDGEETEMSREIMNSLEAYRDRLKAAEDKYQMGAFGRAVAPYSEELNRVRKE